jgi:hypothetical protein
MFTQLHYRGDSPVETEAFVALAACQTALLAVRILGGRALD